MSPPTTFSSSAIDKTSILPSQKQHTMAVPLHPLAAIAQAHGADWLTQNLPPSAGQVVTTMPTQFPRLSWNGFLSLYDAFAQVYGAFFLGHPPDMPGRANASFIGTSKMLGEGADGVAGLWLRVVRYTLSKKLHSALITSPGCKQ